MQELIISTSENVLKVSTVDKGEFNGVSAQITQDVVDDHEILNVNEYASALRDLISTITKKSHRSLLLNFIIEPHEVVLKFITLTKGVETLEDQLMNEARAKVTEYPLDDMHYSFLKVAPFVYQFIGVKKSTLEKYIELSNILGIGLKGVYPWISFLPKIVETNEPKIFISKLAGKQIVALSEFNGIFFSGVYEKEKSTEELQKIVTELSVYKRKNPISKVYVYKYEGFSLSSNYEVLNIDIPNSELEAAQGYELHLLLTHMEARDSALAQSKLNLLTHLPDMVVKEKKNLMPVYIGGATILLLLGGLIATRSLRSETPKVETPSAQSIVTPTEPAVEKTTPPVVEEEVKPEVVLNKSDLSIMVENGAGVAGVAGRTQTFLEEAGYTVFDIGNADEVGRTTTLVKLKASKADYQTLLAEDLKDSFTVVFETDLSDESEYDALMVVGTDGQL